MMLAATMAAPALAQSTTYQAQLGLLTEGSVAGDPGRRVTAPVIVEYRLEGTGCTGGSAVPTAGSASSTVVILQVGGPWVASLDPDQVSFPGTCGVTTQTVDLHIDVPPGARGSAIFEMVATPQEPPETDPQYTACRAETACTVPDEPAYAMVRVDVGTSDTAGPALARGSYEAHLELAINEENGRAAPGGSAETTLTLGYVLGGPSCEAGKAPVGAGSVHAVIYGFSRATDTVGNIAPYEFQFEPVCGRATREATLSVLLPQGAIIGKVAIWDIEAWTACTGNLRGVACCPSQGPCIWTSDNPGARFTVRVVNASELQTQAVLPGVPLPLLAGLPAILLVALAAMLVAKRRGVVVPRTSATPPEPGQLFLGKYRVERELGRGAFGSTWLASHVKLGRPVVIKQLHPEWSAVAEARARFEREARILASLDHPHVTRIYDVEQVAHAWYLVMEYVDGGSLEGYLTRGPMAAADARRVFLEVLDGLAGIHAAGVLHRDLKPSNILLTSQGTAKLADFGVARSRNFQSTMLTVPGSPSPGTPVYMSPEQVRGLPGDARSDLYALAAAFYRAVAGRTYLDPLPEDPLQLLRAIAESPPALPLESLPPALNAWLAKGLAKSPADRFQSATEMADALRRAF